MKFKRKKGIKTVILVLLCMAVVGVLTLAAINIYVKESVKNRILTMEEAKSLDSVDCILVLGAGVRDGKPTAMLKDRLELGIELYRLGISDRLLVSGDHGRIDYDEVNTMKQIAIEAGIPSENIFMDHAGFSTYESLYRARDIFQADKIVIVTQNYHMYRALYDGKGLGLTVYGVSSDPQSYAGQTKRELRETLARVKDFLYVLVKPEPTYLGDTIPVSGNGDVTNDKTNDK
jgi:vancomycin permeability regulator SanA